ncbi:uncharacterized protein [Onthophagus taurus]|uniref:uncharacterized protein n=1 Tax=Onthophagus taurus TaxID=166361 RepID=UPI000C202446|nr:uncharacterized protein LOC111414868 [Onthophagus taurus]
MSGNSVKQELYDDSEIAELASKIYEANKAKMNSAAQRQNNRPTTGGQSNLLNFLTRTNGSGKLKPDTPPANGEASKSNIDERSQKGQFGWTVLGKNNVPYIFRGEDKYCAVKMVEVKVLNKYLCFLHQDIYNCTCIRSYYITEAESRLLNEINFVHCDTQFGPDQYSTRDLIVRLHDAVEFYKFLDACYTKLLNGSSNPLDRCGFIRINKESVVPYTVYTGEKYVPLFYFEGETDNLKLKANKLEGWDLSYLKFCCKVQGIRNELFAHDSCSVISLNDIKNYFPPGTLFEDYWPNKMVDSQLLINGKSQTSMGQWTRQPAAPPVTTIHPAPSPKATQSKPVNNNNHIHQPGAYQNTGFYTIANTHVYPNQQQPLPGQRTPNTAVRSSYGNGGGTAAPSTRQARPYYTNMPQAPPPPPLIRTGQPAPLGYTTAQTTVAGNYLMLGDTNVDQTGYRQGSPQLSKYPSAMPQVTSHINGGMRFPTTAQNHYSTSDVVDLSSQANNNQNHTIVNQQPAHQQSVHQPPHSTSALQEERSSMTNGRVNMGYRKTLPAHEANTVGFPYKMRKALLEEKMIQCINYEPYNFSDLLVTLNELAMNFFNNVPVQSLHQAMQALGIKIFKGNTSQMRVLLENGKCQNLHEIVTMVQLRDVIDYMPQLKYILMGPFCQNVAAKRGQLS